MTRPSQHALLPAFVAALAALGGCAQRTLTITSDPPGALVWLNDQELGRTPVETQFKYFGTYDIRLALDGYEPVLEGRKLDAPWYEFPPIDLVAEAIPTGVTTRRHWHYNLRPSPAPGVTPEQFQVDFLQRAASTRSLLTGEDPASAPAEEAPALDASSEANAP